METQYDDTGDERRDKRGCFECCIKCLGGVPYASLVATILCFCGVALFCGCGHVALTGTLTILENHFSRITTDHATLSDITKHQLECLRSGAAFAKTVHSSLSQFVLLTYILGIAWLGVFGFSAVPVFLFYNVRSTCAAMRSPMANLTSVDSICVDVRQYGIIPWNATPGKACGSTLADICNTSEFYLSYHLFIVACAGAGATVIALLIYMMATTYNFAVLKFKSREDCCTKF
ncbi:neuronal membrane glycoprotein M6-b-like [Sinocyclocheilus anshuiensis]|uniref:neuronal membrane glycoprotein M6-b-like n=1 Tax=Sinocyclocheilus anshuiensis TaxID=1608454 RepID=UPI0007BA21E7|nr:PREDICTED: neuronal membrane glycoprotein M6-b-like [Sinocyclocheilus anshuiensis]